MMKTRIGWTLIIAFYCCAFLVTRSSSNEQEEANTLLQRTLGALKRTLNYFGSVYKKVNLDTVIGTRIVDGILTVLLHRIDNDMDSWPLNETIIQTIRDLKKQAGLVSDQSVPYVRCTDRLYYRRLGMLVQKDFWAIDFASRDFLPENFIGAWLPQRGESFIEADSDNCITELFGTGTHSRAKCQISTPCWKMMTATGYSGYSLTHEVFYLMIAYRTGCSEEMNLQRILHDQPPLSELIGQFCASIYLEATNIQQNGYPQLKQDLFMEQAVLCGNMGYRWLFSPEWLGTILSWQDQQSGCYKGDTIHDSGIEYRHKDADGSNHLNYRVKREERVLDDGCLCHRTAVAAGALASYVRYIAEYLQQTFERT